MKEKKFQCESCGRTFTQRGSLVRHQHLHTGEKPFICETCGRAFSEKGSLDTHQRLHTGEKPYECRICHERFAQRASIQRHLRQHVLERQAKLSQKASTISQEKADDQCQENQALTNHADKTVMEVLSLDSQQII